MDEVNSSFTIVPITVVTIDTIRLRGSVWVEKIYWYASSVKSRIINPSVLEKEDIITYQNGTIHVNAQIPSTR